MKKCGVIFLLILCVFAPLAQAQMMSARQIFVREKDPKVTLDQHPDDIEVLILVNKQQGLAYDFEPELVTPNVKNKKGISIQTTNETALALENLFEDALKEGIEFVAVSGYRSYYIQKTIYNRKVKELGEKSASLSSAPPGKSEHQLGMAVDVSCEAIDCRLTAQFADTKEGQWLYEHCSEYGFIIRYKTEWTDVTGYKGEPWHLRYVGQEHAKRITELNVPLEIYLAYLEFCYNDKQNEGN